MVLADSNIWLALALSKHEFHVAARNWLAKRAPREALFCRSTQQSFLRLATTLTLLKAYGAEGMTNRDALLALEALIALPQVCLRDEPPGVSALWHRIAACDTASPKVWMDAYLAAFAIRAGVRLVTLDGDFKKYRRDGLDLLLLGVPEKEEA